MSMFMERFGKNYWIKTNRVENCEAWMIPMRSWCLRGKDKDNDHHLEKLKKYLRESSRIINTEMKEMKSINRKHMLIKTENKFSNTVKSHYSILTYFRVPKYQVKSYGLKWKPINWKIMLFK